MIKRAVVFFGLAILCIITVFGTGFALWSFDKQSVATQNMGVHVTQSAVLGKFEVPEIAQVVLDGGTGSGVNPTITGVSFYKENEQRVAVTDNSFTISFAVNDVYREQMSQDGNWDRVYFGIRIDVPSGLEGLITHTEFYNARMQDNGYIDLKALTVELTDHFDDTGYVKTDFKYDEDAGTFTFALTTTTLNRFFTYLPAEEPTTLEKYGNLYGNFAACFTIELWQGYGQTA